MNRTIESRTRKTRLRVRSRFCGQN